MEMDVTFVPDEMSGEGGFHCCIYLLKVKMCIMFRRTVHRLSGKIEVSYWLQFEICSKTLRNVHSGQGLESHHHRLY